MRTEASSRKAETEQVRDRIAARILDILDGSEEKQTCVDGLTIIQRTRPIPPTSYIYNPSLAMIMRGRKNILIGDTAHFYDESLFFLTSVDLPTVTEVVGASPERPYVSVLLTLDLQLAREIITEVDLDDSVSPDSSGQEFGPADRPLLEAMERLVSLASSSKGTRYLAELAKRELLYRLLTGPNGERVRRTAHLGATDHRVSHAVSWLRENYASPLRVKALASLCDMAESTLHQRFRALTSMSPLQYQKQLRLHEARRILLSEEVDAATAAIRVGYESVTQFNREYKRVFGAPPRRDIVQLRHGR